MARTDGLYIETITVGGVDDGGDVELEVTRPDGSTVATVALTVTNGQATVDIPAGTTATWPNEIRLKINATQGELFKTVTLRNDIGRVEFVRDFIIISIPALLNMGITLSGTGHTFTWSDPDPVPFRKYQITINGATKPGIVVALTTQLYVTGLPNDGSLIDVRLTWWDNDDILTSKSISGTVTAHTAISGTGTQFIIPGTNIIEGDYTSVDFNEAIPTLTPIGWEAGGDTITTVSTIGGRRSLGIRLDDTVIPSTRAGAEASLSPSEKVTLEQWVYFDAGFDWGGTNEGGKLGFGLAGGSRKSDGLAGPEDTDTQTGFSARLMWRTGGALYAYIYEANSTSNGDDYALQWNATRATWINLKMEVQMNSVAGVSDGKLKVWINGVLHLDVANINWFGQNAPQIDTLTFLCVHGGTDATWSPSRVNHLYFSGIYWALTTEVLPNDPPVFLAPAPAYVATSTSVTFSWEGSPGFYYDLLVYTDAARTQKVRGTDGVTFDTINLDTATTHTFNKDPGDGAERYVRLYWWADNSFTVGGQVDMQYTAAATADPYRLSEVLYAINTEDLAAITITASFQVTETATGLAVDSVSKTEFSLVGGSFEYNHTNSTAYKQHSQVVPMDNATYTTNRGPDIASATSYQFRVTSVVVATSEVLVSPVTIVEVPAVTTVRIINQRIEFDASYDPATLRAKNIFDNVDQYGALYPANSWTNWGPTGLRPLPYQHLSPGLYGSNTQILPGNPVNTGIVGGYLQEGQKYDYQTFTRDPSTAVVVSLPISSFNAPVGSVVTPPPPTGSQSYDNLESPPILDPNNLVRILSVNDLQPMSWPSNGENCGGTDVMWTISVPIDQDIFIDLDGALLTKPILIYGGRHCIWKNPQIKLAPVGGCGIGEKRISSAVDGRMSEHPRVPGNRAVGLWNFGTTFIDGGWIRNEGHEADIFVGNGGKYGGTEQSTADANARREMVFVNLRAEGFEGTPAGQHGDIFHNQDISHKSARFENIVCLSSYNGITQQNRGGYNNENLRLRNYTHDIDPRFGADQSMSGDSDTRPDNIWGPVFTTRTEFLEILGECYFRNPTGDSYSFFGIHNGPPSSQYTQKTYFWDPADKSPSSTDIVQSNIHRMPGDITNYNDGNHDIPAEANWVPEAWAAAYESPWQQEYIDRGYY